MKNSYNRIVVGNIVPMLTYFNEEGIIDEVSCKLQALHILSNGGDAIFLLGSTGEGIYIKNISVKNPDERFKLVLSVIDAIIQYQFLKKKFIPILIGTYGESFSEVLEEIELYQKSIISYLKENEFNYKFIIKFSPNLCNASMYCLQSGGSIQFIIFRSSKFALHKILAISNGKIPAGLLFASSIAFANNKFILLQNPHMSAKSLGSFLSTIAVIFFANIVIANI